MKALTHALKEGFCAMGTQIKNDRKASPALLKRSFSKETVSSIFSVRGIVYMALLVALSVVLRVFTSINIGNLARVELGFLPIAVSAVFFGPVGGALCYTLADIIGTVVVGQSIFFPITLCKLLFGFLMGLFFFDRRLSPIKVFLAMLTVAFAVDLAAMTAALYALYGSEQGMKAVFITRLYNAGITLPLRFFLIYLSDYALHFRDLWRKKRR